MLMKSFIGSIFSKWGSENLRGLERFVAVFSIISLIGISLFVGVTLHVLYRGHVIRNAEENALKIGYMIFEREKTLLSGSDERSGQVLAVAPRNFPLLDQRILLYLQPLNIVKIKFFDPARKVVYSSDHSIIGQVDTDNASLDRALAGEITSKITKKGSVLDLAGETRMDVDVVETYFPVIDSTQKKIGAFETYSDVSRSYAEIRAVSQRSVAVLVSVLAAVFGTLLFAMRKLTKRLASVQAELKQSSITDHLTNVFNRGYLISRAEEELKKMWRQGAGSTCTGFVLLDLDDFKTINDRFGHLAGDRVLQEVALRVKLCVREYDIVGRLGGEEFFIILPSTQIAEARQIADRIWKRLRECPIEAGGTSLLVTASIGVACLTGRERTIQEVLQKADERMYRAKHQGKDRVVASEERVAES
jgi:diguanylate cyclase (GGDEF)-like protein